MLSFLSFPPEVRNDIYKRTLIIPADYVIDFTEPMTLSSSYPPKFIAQEAQLTRSTNQHSSFEEYEDDEEHSGNNKPHMPEAQLLRTCKTINHEAAHFLYGYNTFAFELPRNFKDFYKMAGLKNVLHVRHLQINYLLHTNWDSQFDWSIFKVNEAFTMEQLRINCPNLIDIKALYFPGLREARAEIRIDLQKKAIEKHDVLAREAGLHFWNESLSVLKFPLLEADNISTVCIFAGDAKKKSIFVGKGNLKPLVQKIIFKMR